MNILADSGGDADGTLLYSQKKSETEANRISIARDLLSGLAIAFAIRSVDPSLFTQLIASLIAVYTRRLRRKKETEFSRKNSVSSYENRLCFTVRRMAVRTIETCVFILVFMCTVAGCTNREQDQARSEGKPDGAAELTVFAAASLTEAITKISRSFESKRDVKIYMNFAGSQTLQLQIERGAPADLFISASPKQMDALEEKGAIHESSRRNVLRNSLVLVAPIEASRQIQGPENLTQSSIRRIAIGEPSSVPAGIYGAEALKRLGIWAGVQPKLIPGADVRSVLAYTESGEVDFGIVYRTDASVSEKVRVAYEFPTSSHSPIVYPAAVIRGAKHEDLARLFLRYLKTSEVKHVFENYGFSVVK